MPCLSVFPTCFVCFTLWKINFYSKTIKISLYFLLRFFHPASLVHLSLFVVVEEVLGCFSHCWQLQHHVLAGSSFAIDSKRESSYAKFPRMTGLQSEAGRAQHLPQPQSGPCFFLRMFLARFCGKPRVWLYLGWRVIYRVTGEELTCLQGVLPVTNMLSLRLFLSFISFNKVIQLASESLCISFVRFKIGFLLRYIIVLMQLWMFFS